MPDKYEETCNAAVDKFAGLMKKVLAKKREKGHWGGIGPADLAQAAQRHMSVIFANLNGYHSIVLDECVDVANCLMMVADNLYLLDRPELLEE